MKSEACQEKAAEFFQMCKFVLERRLKREIFPKLEESESVYSVLAEHLAFMQEIMSVPLEEQPNVIFCLPDLPVRIDRRKVKK